MIKSKAKAIIKEFSTQIVAQRWTRDRVNDLKVALWKEPSFEQGRIFTFCELYNYVEPDSDEFTTLEAFQTELQAEAAAHKAENDAEANCLREPI